MDWQLVRNKAAEMVEELVYKAPDLKERTHYPRCQNGLYDVMPIRSRYVCALRTTLGQEQASSSIIVTCTFQYQMSDLLALRPNLASYHRRQQVKNIGHKQLTDLAQFYLQLKKRYNSNSIAVFSASSFFFFYIRPALYKMLVCAGCLQVRPNAMIIQVLYNNDTGFL